MNCPLCASPGTEIFRVNQVPIEDCPHCGHRFAAYEASKNHVAENYGDAYFEAGGVGYPDYLSESNLLCKHGRRYAKMLQQHTKPGRVLSVGCAAGFLLQSFVHEGWEGVGVEPNPKMARFAREQLHLQVFCNRLEDPALKNPETDFGRQHPFDLVTWIQVLPHFVNPRQAMECAAQQTRPGGLWLIETWDWRSRVAQWAGPKWHEYSPPSVLHWFTRKSVCTLAHDFGFREVAHGRPQKRISMRHIRSLLKEKADASMLKKIMLGTSRFLPDRLILPYPSFDLFWTLLQKEETSRSTTHQEDNR